MKLPEDEKNQSRLSLSTLKALQQLMKSREDVEFSLLFGSQARGDSNEQSDWDIAFLLKDNTNGWNNLGKREEIRHLISSVLAVSDNDVDLVDLYRAGLGINATIVDEGIPLAGEDSLALASYYQRVWANLEDYYWNLDHVS